MADPYQADHVGEGLDELLSQFRFKPNVIGYLTGLLEPVQDLEDDAWDLRADRLLSTAIGAQLDVLGRLVGEGRGTFGDADYRKFIGARILVNLSSGTPDELLAILTIIAAPLSAGTVVEYSQVGYGPAYRMTVIRDAAMAADVAARVLSMMAAVNPAGVGATIVLITGTTFRFDTGPGFDQGRFGSLL